MHLYQKEQAHRTCKQRTLNLSLAAVKSLAAIMDIEKQDNAADHTYSGKDCHGFGSSATVGSLA